MTPPARYAAAIAILDQITAGTPAEVALTRWARASRFAGSKDRRAVRDIVYDILRSRASCAWLGKGETGRALVLGYLRLEGVEPDTVFGCGAYAPDALTDDESVKVTLVDAPETARLNIPDWLIPEFDRSLGDQMENICKALQHRAPVGLRVNIRKAKRVDVITALQAQGLAAEAHDASPLAITMPQARGLEQTSLYKDGVIELQDPGAQALVAALPLEKDARLLDYCAGGGGKALAVAAIHDGKVDAHDISEARLQQLTPRAARAGVEIDLIKPNKINALYDGILLDVPCSGSGAWRRQPDAKWRLTSERLSDLCNLQTRLLSEAAQHLKPQGWIAYMTCSLFNCENDAPIAQFCAENSAFIIEQQRVFTPLDGTDGFGLTILRHRVLPSA